MSADELVDSTQLDADLTSVANAIRTKGGTSAQLAFPADFVAAINAISGGGGGDELPAGYTQMAYIANDGQAFIDTGYKWLDNSKLEVLCGYIQAQSGFANLLGNGACFMQKGSGGVSGCTLNAKINSASYTSVYVSVLKGWLVVEQEQLSQYDADYIGGVSLLRKTGNVQDYNANIALYARLKDDNTHDHPTSNFAIWRFKHTRNGTLIQELVPAMRDSDSALGFYDIVNQQFLSNAGSGAFYGGSL